MLADDRAMQRATPPRAAQRPVPPAQNDRYRPHNGPQGSPAGGFAPDGTAREIPGRRVLLEGAGAGPEGYRPFIDVADLDSGAQARFVPALHPLRIRSMSALFPRYVRSASAPHPVNDSGPCAAQVRRLLQSSGKQLETPGALARNGH